jgi:surface carbohydrate biosynthesis protein
MVDNVKKYKVCLIVDNPLRDLEGLTLLAWHLVRKDIETYLVPMYTQISDIYAIKPDLILMNYVRPNNIKLLEKYKKSGIKIGVLDTEGTAGKNSDEFAKLVRKVDNLDVVDLYCLWGREQYNSFKKYNLFRNNELKITGCPRYDFCHKSLRSALPTVNDIENYILINTNFPTANPRFTKSSKNEIDTMIKVGFDPEFAIQFVHDSKTTHQSIIKLIIKIAYKFPENNFVLRPHPFEDLKAYNRLLEFNNVFIIQKGTSLEWINSAKALIHLNCSTAIEAAMLDKYAISLEWLNTRFLLIPNAKSVSFHANSERHLTEIIMKIFNNNKLNLDHEVKTTKSEIIESLYEGNDGKSSERVANAINSTLEECCESNNYYSLPRFSFNRGDVVFFLQKVFGYNAYLLIQKIFKKQEDVAIKGGKFFKESDVRGVLDRINSVLHKDYNNDCVVATKVSKSELYNSQIYSDKSVKITLKSLL